MKRQNRIPQLTLELYCRGLATRRERKQVEQALLSDTKVREYCESLKEKEREMKQLVTQETLPVRRAAIPVWGIIAAAAVLICALVPTFFYIIKSHSSKKENVIAENAVEAPVEETVDEKENSKDTANTEPMPENMPTENTPAPQQPNIRERGGSSEKPKITESPRPNPAGEKEFQSGGTEIAAIPAPDTGVRTRGQIQEQRGSAAAPEQESNLIIPSGITFIFDNMFANKQLSYAVIPDRITSIGKNAFAGNPLTSVTIGANVNVDEEAIPGNFAKAYNANGKAAGVYRRPGVNSGEWVRE